MPTSRITDLKTLETSSNSTSCGYIALMMSQEWYLNNLSIILWSLEVPLIVFNLSLIYASLHGFNAVPPLEEQSPL